MLPLLIAVFLFSTRTAFRFTISFSLGSVNAFVYFKINLIKCNNYDKHEEKIEFSLG